MFHKSKKTDLTPRQGKLRRMFGRMCTDAYLKFLKGLGVAFEIFGDKAEDETLRSIGKMYQDEEFHALIRRNVGDCYTPAIFPREWIHNLRLMIPASKEGAAFGQQWVLYYNGMGPKPRVESPKPAKTWTYVDVGGNVITIDRDGNVLRIRRNPQRTNTSPDDDGDK